MASTGFIAFTWFLTTVSAIDIFYKTQINAKSRHLQHELKCITKGEKSIAEFLACIQQITDTLESIGDSVSIRDQMEAIFDSFLEEYNALTTIIQYCDEEGPCSILVAETMLLSHEARLECCYLNHWLLISLWLHLKLLLMRPCKETC